MSILSPNSPKLPTKLHCHQTPQTPTSEGIPDRPWFKHVLYAPRYTYAAMSLPGIQEAVEAADWDRARRQVELLTRRLEAAAVSLESSRQRLIQISQ